MKKILVLLLIFGMASLANGAYAPMTLTLSAPASEDVGNVITVDVAVSGLPGDASVQSLINAVVDVTAGGGATYTTSSTVTFNTRFNSGTNSTGFANVALNANPPYPYASGSMFSFTVTGTAKGTLDFDLSSLSPGSPNYLDLTMAAIDSGGTTHYSFLGAPAGYGPMTIIGTSTTVIPEPMTILLLGLGGLFLRRRR